MLCAWPTVPALTGVLRGVLLCSGDWSNVMPRILSIAAALACASRCSISAIDIGMSSEDIAAGGEKELDAGLAGTAIGMYPGDLGGILLLPFIGDVCVELFKGCEIIEFGVPVRMVLLLL